MSEYANTTGSKKDHGHLARFYCNNDIAGNYNITDAKKTYNALYNLYKTEEPTTIITEEKLGNTNNHCAFGVDDTMTRKCPYSDSLLVNPASNVYAYSTLNGKNGVYASDLPAYLDDCGARIRDYDNNATNVTKSYTEDLNYANNLHDISYGQLVKIRNNLDYQVNEILANNKNSILYEKQNELDASVYSTLLWTVMITSLIYYVFTKI